MKKLGKKPIIFAAALIISLAAEFLLFNFGTLASLGGSWQSLGVPEENVSSDENGVMTGIEYLFADVDAEIGYCHADVRAFDENGEDLPVKFDVMVTDEGNSAAYYAGTVSYTANHTRDSYFRINTYGKARTVKFVIQAGNAVKIDLVAAEINGTVPLFFSFKRVILIFALLLLLYALRPSSRLHDNGFWNARRCLKTVCVLLLVVLNITGVTLLALTDDPFVDIPDDYHWYHHEQYADLARSFTKGRLDIDYQASPNIGLEVLDSLENPYDTYERGTAFSRKQIHSPWDIAYYNGKLYVYFGALPVVLLYLPYHLVTGGDLPNVAAFIVSYFALICAAFCFMRSLIRNKFPNTPFSIYLLLSLLTANGIGTLQYAFAPSFYCLPIITSCALALFGAALWISASGPVSDEIGFGRAFLAKRAPRAFAAKVAGGSLLIALTAGARPQFLVFSLFVFPLILPTFKAGSARRRIATAAAVIIPFAAVATVVMLYNSARFGSPFDFGANYNLTTNDMRLRGFNIARLPDGLFSYLFQLPNFSHAFPYVLPTDGTTVYMGITIREIMTGGAFFTNIFLWAGFLVRSAYAKLREKKLFSLYVVSAICALIVIVADTEMAGILSRYAGDFLLLLLIPAALVFLQKIESAPADKRRRLILFAVASVFAALAFSFFAGITTSELCRWDADSYAAFKNFFRIF